MRKLVTEIERQNFYYTEIDPLRRHTDRLFAVFICCVALWSVILVVSILAYRDSNHWLCGFTFVLSSVFSCVSAWCVIEYRKFSIRIEKKYSILNPR